MARKRCKRREPCPAGIEDACPVPRYRCREVGQLGKHCFELFAEFELFVLPEAAEAVGELPSVRGERQVAGRDSGDDPMSVVLRHFDDDERV